MLDAHVMKLAILLFNIDIVLRKLLAGEREQNCSLFSPSPPSLFLAQWAVIDQKTEWEPFKFLGPKIFKISL